MHRVLGSPAEVILAIGGLVKYSVHKTWACQDFVNARRFAPLDPSRSRKLRLQCSKFPERDGRHRVSELLRIIAVFVVLVCGFGSRAFAGDGLEDLRGTFRSLRNTDIEVSEPAKWRHLAGRLLAEGQQSDDREAGARAVLDAAAAYETLYEVTKDRKDLQLSAAALETLMEVFRDTSVADEALFRLGNLAQRFPELGRDPSEIFRRVQREFPNSEYSPLATARLAGVRIAESHGGEALAAPVGTPSIRVVLDPGHGGEDLGAEGPSGLMEKDVVLDVAYLAKVILERRLNAAVTLTRGSDVFVPLATRTKLANDFKADIFVSLHTNAVAGNRGRGSGMETYYLNTADDEASRLMAERENRSIDLAGVTGKGKPPAIADLEFMLSDLIQSGKTEDSIRLANHIQQALWKRTRIMFPAAKSRGVKRAPFYVLVGAHMPCVLVEMFFIDNPNEARQLSTGEFREAVAEGLVDGIQEFMTLRGK